MFVFLKGESFCWKLLDGAYYFRHLLVAILADNSYSARLSFSFFHFGFALTAKTNFLAFGNFFPTTTHTISRLFRRHHCCLPCFRHGSRPSKKTLGETKNYPCSENTPVPYILNNILIKILVKSLLIS